MRFSDRPKWRCSILARDRRRQVTPLTVFTVILVRSFCLGQRSADARKNDPEFGELTGPGVDLDRSAVLLHDNVVTEGKPEPRPFTGRLGGEKRIEYFFFHVRRHAGAIVADANLDAVPQILCRRHECWLVAIAARF